jgi:glycosyltransferase involved in cell wall biosynthesis
MTIRVSVVLATYNRGPLLLQLLEDLRAQTFPCDQFEVVVVDDGSTVPVTDVVATDAMPYRLALLRQTNAGPAAARDRGVKAAEGEIVIITDDDMRLRPDFIAQHMQAHDSGATVVLGHIAASSHLADMPIFERFHAAQLARFIQGVKDKRIAVRGVHVCTGNISFRRQDYLALGGFDPNLKRSEDRELGVRLEKSGATLVFNADAICEHESDHTDLNVWLKRAFNYGVFDRRIAQKHPDVENADPWRFFFLVSPLSRPLLASVVLAPQVLAPLTRLTMRAAILSDEAGYTKPALLGTTLAYGLEYFRGMRHDAGSIKQAAQDLMGYLAKRKAVP